MDVPDVGYARSGDVAIAYQTVGDGPPDLVFLPFLANIYTLWQAPGFARFGRRLATGQRLIVVNPRGVGLTDRPRGFTVESRMDDIRAVLDDLGVAAPRCSGWRSRRRRARSLRPRIRTGSSGSCSTTRGAARSRSPPREQELARLREERDGWGRRAYLQQLAAFINPQWADDRDYLEWFVWHHRLTASPAAWVEFRRMQIDLDISDVLPAIRVPTLVISKEFLEPRSRPIADAIAGAELVLVPGLGGSIYENEYPAEALESFLSGALQDRIPDTVLATVLFTDLVDSTRRAVELGDRGWRELLERHNELVRRELGRYRGVELDTAGDGFFASFDGPARAIGCARAIVGRVAELGPRGR